MKNNGVQGLPSFVYGFISITFLILFWEYMGIKEWKYINIFPPPSHFLSDLVNSDFKVGIGSNASTIPESMFSSIMRVIIGIILGIVSAILLGSLMTISKWLRRFIFPIVRILAPIAPIAWIPLALVVFGIGNSAAIFIVFMGVFFMLTIATIHAIDIVPQNLINTAKTLGINTKFGMWIKVTIPAILPSIFTMLRLNFIAAWMAVLAAEMTGLRDGLGAIIMTGRNLFNNDLILLGMTLIGIVGFIFDILLKVFQDKFLWWDKLSNYGGHSINKLGKN